MLMVDKHLQLVLELAKDLAVYSVAVELELA